MRNRLVAGQTGFSIVETVVALALMIILIMAAIPFVLDSVSALQLSGDAQNIASELQLAKFKASSQSTPFRVAFDIPAHTFTLQKLVGQSYHDEGGPIALASTSLYIKTPASVPSGAPSTMSSNIRFNSHGMPIDNNGAPTANNGIYLGLSSNASCAIIVPISGRVQIWWFDGSQWSMP
ncbi:MAG: hypothetical protein HY232_19145 [Acidobacteria bacterium]|nr:hypothetical protein [Acidobacteriota bacterium]